MVPSRSRRMIRFPESCPCETAQTTGGDLRGLVKLSKLGVDETGFRPIGFGAVENGPG